MPNHPMAARLVPLAQKSVFAVSFCGSTDPLARSAGVYFSVHEDPRLSGCVDEGGAGVTYTRSLYNTPVDSLRAHRGAAPATIPPPPPRRPPRCVAAARPPMGARRAVRLG